MNNFGSSVFYVTRTGKKLYPSKDQGLAGKIFTRLTEHFTRFGMVLPGNVLLQVPVLNDGMEPQLAHPLLFPADAPRRSSTLVHNGHGPHQKATETVLGYTKRLPLVSTSVATKTSHQNK